MRQESFEQLFSKQACWPRIGWGWRGSVSVPQCLLTKQFGEAIKAGAWDNLYETREITLQNYLVNNLCANFFFFFFLQSVLPVFRCVNVLERNVEKCSIYTNNNDCHITFQLLCKHGRLRMKWLYRNRSSLKQRDNIIFSVIINWMLLMEHYAKHLQPLHIIIYIYHVHHLVKMKL